jgi:hypothetical protein
MQTLSSGDPRASPVDLDHLNSFLLTAADRRVFTPRLNMLSPQRIYVDVLQKLYV